MTVATRDSFVERNGRERAYALLDNGTFRELVGPFDRMESPHLKSQGIVPQSDDGVIVARGRISGKPAVVISIESDFQGGGIGEVSGAKIAGALEMALRDHHKGLDTHPVLLFDTGGVRLQEANYGLLSIAEIGSAIVALRSYIPVVGVIPGKIGVFGGMSLIAGLCDTLIMTREGRLGLNGPEVIEQEAGIQELDSRDRQRIWGTIGGEQRVETGFADILVDDDMERLTTAVRTAFENKQQEKPRSSRVKRYRDLLKSVDPHRSWNPFQLRTLWEQGEPKAAAEPSPKEGGQQGPLSRGRIWFNALTGEQIHVGDVPSVLCAEGKLEGEQVRYLTVAPDPTARYPRACQGEVGVEEGWKLAEYIRDAVEEDQGNVPRPIVAIVDVPCQAYGYMEELLGIHQSCAAAVDAYATARLAGHPIISLIVGQAISGAFLAHGLQANRIIAFDDEKVQVHVMSKQSAARITRRSVDELEEASKRVPGMAYDIQSFASLGAVDELLRGVNFDQPKVQDCAFVQKKLFEAITDARSASRDLSHRLASSQARRGRTSSIRVRGMLAEQW